MDKNTPEDIYRSNKNQPNLTQSTRSMGWMDRDGWIGMDEWFRSIEHVYVSNPSRRYQWRPPTSHHEQRATTTLWCRKSIRSGDYTSPRITNWHSTRYSIASTLSLPASHRRQRPDPCDRGPSTTTDFDAETILIIHVDGSRSGKAIHRDTFHVLCL